MRALRTAVVLALWRIRAAWGSLLACVVVGATFTGLWVAVPLYSEAASAGLLVEELDESADERIPLGYLFSYNRLSGGNRSWADIQPVDDYLQASDSPVAAHRLDASRVIESAPFQLVVDAARPDDTRLAGFSMAAIDGFDEVAVIDAGRAPAIADGAIEVAVEASIAERFGISPGDVVGVVGLTAERIDVTVVGVWSGVAPEPSRVAAAILADVEVLRRSLIVHDDALDGSELDAGPLFQSAQWVVLLDPTDITTSEVPAVLDDATAVDADIDALLSGTRRLASPATALERFATRADQLERGLSRFTVPTMVLLSVSLLGAGFVAGRARSAEVGALGRRGVERRHLATTVGVEWITVAVPIAALGALVGHALARVLARTETILRLGAPPELPFVWSDRSTEALFVAVLVGLTVLAAGWVGGLGRWSGSPRLRRATRGADVVVALLVAAFVVGALRGPQPEGGVLDTGDVVVVGAAIGVLAAVVGVRAVPLVGRLIAGVGGRGDAVTALVAGRVAHRQPRRLAPLVALIITTLTFAGVTASLARTADFQTHDDAHHALGAAVSVVDHGDAHTGSAEYRSLLDEPAARMVRVPAAADVPGVDDAVINVIAVDPLEFAEVGFWRDDYADRSVEELMTLLATHREGVLMSETMLVDHDWAVGDVVGVEVVVGGERVATPMVVVGSFREFPTWYGDREAPVLVAGFELLAESTLERVPRTVLMSDGDGLADVRTRIALGRDVGVEFGPPVQAQAAVERAFAHPDRQGAFGLLNVGFAVAAALAVAGFLFLGVVELQSARREVGVLRSLGLPARVARRIIGVEVAIVVTIGGGIGVVAGLGGAAIALDQLLPEGSTTSPPNIVELDLAAAFGLLGAVVVAGVIAVGSMAVALQRLRLGDMVRMGEHDG